MTTAQNPAALNVALILDTLTRAGAQVQATMLARELAALGSRVTILLLEHPDDSPLPRVDGVTVLSTPVGRLNGPAVAGQLKGLVGELRRLNPDVVHTFLFKANLIGAVAARLAGVPVVAGSRRSMGYDQNRRRALLSRLGNRLVDGVVANASCILEAARELEGTALPCPAVIANGVAVPAALAGGTRPRRTRNIGILANVRPVKGHDLALAAFATVVREEPSARLHLMGDRRGDASWSLHIDNLAESLQVADRIVWHDPDRPVAEFFGEIEFLVSSSRSEGLSNAILEAMAAGVPVVATDVGGSAEALGGTGTLVAPDDVAALAEAMLQHVQNPVHGVRQAKAALRRARENFDPAVMAGRHLRWYRWLRETAGSGLARLPLVRPRRRVVIAIDQLDTGGTERQLGIWAAGLRERHIPLTVVCLRSGGRTAGQLERSGVDVRVLGKRFRFDPVFLLRQQWLLWRLRPRTVLALLTTAGIWTVPAARLAGAPQVVFSMRATALTDDPAQEGPVGLLARALRWAHTVVGNSPEVLDFCRQRLQVPAPRTVLLPNIIGGAELRKEPRSVMRGQGGLPQHGPLVGIVARLVPVKDHDLFLAAFARVQSVMPAARAVIVGDGPQQQHLENEIARLGLQGRVIMTGHREDALQLARAVDVIMLTSRSEGSPNAVLEAVSVGTPVVSVDVGDVASLLEGTAGRVVQGRDPVRLADATLAVLAGADLCDEGQPAAAHTGETVMDKLCNLLAASGLTREGVTA